MRNVVNQAVFGLDFALGRVDPLSCVIYAIVAKLWFHRPLQLLA
jgi:hypothetical protein